VMMERHLAKHSGQRICFSTVWDSLKVNQSLIEAGAYSQMDWYAMYPYMYVGDASKATAEKGRVLAERRIAGLFH